MKQKPLPLQTVRIRNFKAIRDSGPIKMTPLTVFIGNNGSGKSSLLEAMEFLQTIALQGLEEAVGVWRGIGSIWNKAVSHEPRQGDIWRPNPIGLSVRGHNGTATYDAHSEISEPIGNDVTFFKREQVKLFSRFVRQRNGDLAATEESQSPSDHAKPVKKPLLPPLGPDQSLLGRDGHLSLDRWMFLALDPALMAQPIRRARYGDRRALQRTGQNLAEYLLSFYQASPEGFEALTDTLRLVLPYARSLEPRISEDIIEKRIFLQLAEQNATAVFDLVSWVLSTGTLRILALLACLRHPTRAPAVLFVDEIENGLDPRTIGLLISEIREAVESGEVQVVATTHSPYLLDQLSINQLVVVERDENGAPRFARPADDEHVREWSKEFAPGKLYSMGTLSNRK